MSEKWFDTDSEAELDLDNVDFSDLDQQQSDDENKDPNFTDGNVQCA